MTILMSDYIDTLRGLGACTPALLFAARYDDPQEAWDACTDPDWKHWLLNSLDAWPPGTKKAYLHDCALRTGARFSNLDNAAYAKYKAASLDVIRCLVPTVPTVPTPEVI